MNKFLVGLLFAVSVLPTVQAQDRLESVKGTLDRSVTGRGLLVCYNSKGGEAVKGLTIEKGCKITIDKKPGTSELLKKGYHVTVFYEGIFALEITAWSPEFLAGGPKVVLEEAKPVPKKEPIKVVVTKPPPPLGEAIFWFPNGTAYEGTLTAVRPLSVICNFGAHHRDYWPSAVPVIHLKSGGGFVYDPATREHARLNPVQFLDYMTRMAEAKIKADAIIRDRAIAYMAYVEEMRKREEASTAEARERREREPSYTFYPDITDSRYTLGQWFFGIPLGRVKKD